MKKKRTLASLKVMRMIDKVINEINIICTYYIIII